MSEQTVFDFNIDPDSTFDGIIMVTAKQAYDGTSGSIPWILRVYFDGSEINYAAGAGGVTDAPNLQCIVTGIAAGSHEVKVTWQANTHLKLYNATIAVTVFKK